MLVYAAPSALFSSATSGRGFVLERRAVSGEG
jgi:hypothetical protein